MKNSLEDSHRKFADAIARYTKALLKKRIGEGTNAQTLAKKAKLDPGTVSRWTNEFVMPSVDNCLRAIEAWEGDLVEVLREAAPELAKLVILSEPHPKRTRKLIKILSDPDKANKLDNLLDLIDPD